MTRFTIIGGGGETALAFTKAAVSASHSVHNIVRSSSRDAEITAAGGVPVLFSLVDASESSLSEKLKELKTNSVLFTAGARPGPDSAETARLVDFEGAIKTFKAMQLAEIRRIVHISSIDVRNLSQPPPAWYSEADIEASKSYWEYISDIFSEKLKSDTWLQLSTGLDWTIIRPGQLTDAPSNGRIQLGQLHLSGTVGREDVGLAALALFAEEKSFGLVTDLQGPEEGVQGMEIAKAVRKVVSSA